MRGAVGSLLDDDDDDDSKNGGSSYSIKAVCCDTTCCSVVALSEDYAPLRPCLLWMDARSAPQARRIMDAAKAASSSSDVLTSFPELRVNSDGRGPISAEWLLPKCLWIKENEPEIWEKAHVICEYQDYLNYRLTNTMVASSCNAAVRWHHDGAEVLDRDGRKKEHAGRPMGLYRALGISELADKLPDATLAMGDVVGGLSEAAANDLGLAEGTLVVQVSFLDVGTQCRTFVTGCYITDNINTGRARCIRRHDRPRNNTRESTLSHYGLFSSSLSRHSRACIESRNVGCVSRCAVASSIICRRRTIVYRKITRLA